MNTIRPLLFCLSASLACVLAGCTSSHVPAAAITSTAARAAPALKSEAVLLEAIVVRPTPEDLQAAAIPGK
jgi:hypothetical protein